MNGDFFNKSFTGDILNKRYTSDIVSHNAIVPYTNILRQMNKFDPPNGYVYSNSLGSALKKVWNVTPAGLIINAINNRQERIQSNIDTTASNVNLTQAQAELVQAQAEQLKAKTAQEAAQAEALKLQTSTAVAQEASTSPNYLLYGGIAVAVIALGIGGYFLIKHFKK